MKVQENSFIERLEVIADELKINSLHELAVQAKLKNPEVLYQLKSRSKGRGYPSFITLQKIVKRFPTVNLEYLFGVDDKPLKQDPIKLMASRFPFDKVGPSFRKERF